MPDREPKWYLWLDLETTGLDITYDFVLEGAAILTTPELVVPDGFIPFNEVVKPEGFPWITRLERNPFVENMHTDNGLLDEVYGGKGISYEEFEFSLIRLLRQYEVEPKTVIIAGSGVALFDWPLIQRQFPALRDWFDYFTLDIGPLRRFVKYTLKRPDLVSPEPQEEVHRAFADARATLDQAMWYKEVLGDCPRLPMKDENQLEFEV